MSIQLASSITPKNGNTYYLLDDSYLRGGFRVVNALSDLTNTDPTCYKTGMLAYVITLSEFYQAQADQSWANIPFGEKGDKGDKGDPGTNGTNGTIWYAGTSAPSSALGVLNDFYLDLNLGDVYRKTDSVTWTKLFNIIGPKGDKGDQGDQGIKGDTGVAGSDGTNGAPGVRGSTWTVGIGAPSDQTALSGDMYFDTNTSQVWQFTTQWNQVGSLKGPMGEQGIQGEKGDQGDVGPIGPAGPALVNRGTWTSGTVYNSNEFVVSDGSIAGITSMWLCKLDGFSSTVEPKDDTGNWVEFSNIKGDKGDKGDTGAQGDVGATGATIEWTFGTGVPTTTQPDGTLYIDNATSDLYQIEAGTWTKKANLQGIKGDKGDKGDQGIQGIQGEAAAWHVSEDTSSTAPDGDMLLVPSTGNVYQHLGGAYTLVANIKGPKGDTGATWYSGVGTPNVVGKDGDFYINESTADVYTTTDGTTWTLAFNLKGPKGEATVWHYGATVPDASIGIDGDFYFDTATYDVYNRASGAWTAISNLKGAKGDKGDTGVQGDVGPAGAQILYGTGAPNNANGNNGDSYLDSTPAVFNLYEKVSGAWQLLGSLVGSTGLKGDKGDTGLNGTNGATWSTGTTVPANGSGNVGDFYLNSATADIFQKTGPATWSLLMNIKGPAGTFDQSTVIMPYDIPFTIFGNPNASNAVIGAFAAPREISLKTGVPNGSLALCDVAPTTAQTYSFTRNGTTLGSITFAANSKTGTVTWSSDVMLEIGDVLKLMTPGTLDTAITNLYIVLIGSAHAPAVSM